MPELRATAGKQLPRRLRAWDVRHRPAPSGFADARQQNSFPKIQAATHQYIQFLRTAHRLDEAIALFNKLIAESAASSDLTSRAMAAQERQSLAHLMTEAGQKDQAISILRQNVEAAPSGEAKGQALLALSQMLVAQQQFEDAEKTIAGAQQFAGSLGSDQSKHLQQSLTHVLAQLRDVQGRPQEAAELRSRQVQIAQPQPGPIPLWTLLEPARQAIAARNYDAGIALVENSLASITERVASNPTEITAIVQIATALPPGKARDRMLSQALAILDEITPANHPRLLEAYGQLVFPIITTGTLQHEASPLFDKMERITIAAKGDGSPALNQISRHRIMIFQQAQIWEAAAAEAKKMAVRSEAAAGPRSLLVLNDLRELALLYQQSGDFAAEEGIRLDILKRSEGQGDNFRISDMRDLAQTVYRMGRKEQALGYMDRAIDLVKKSASPEPLVSNLLQQRQSMQTSNPPPAGRWFDSTFRRL